MTVNWQELYAANRAAIARARGGEDPIGGRASGLPTTGLAPSGRPPPGRRTEAPPGGDGGWERLTVRNAGPRGAFLYTPAGPAPGVAVPLVVMLHGCTQTAFGFATATRMNEAADRHRFVVAYPEQARAENPQGCWNWFLPAHQARGAGEPAFLAEVARTASASTSGWTVDPRRVLVAGLSAGGAMAAVVAVTHPDVFGAVAVHSGLPYRAATNVSAAFAAMRGDAGDHDARGWAAIGGAGPPVPLLVVHGTADSTVRPVNADRLLEQWAAAHRHAGADGAGPHPQPPAEHVSERSPGGRSAERRRWTDGAGRLLIEDLRVEGLGHAWSGGRAGAPFSDPAGPSAAEAIARFLAETLS